MAVGENIRKKRIELGLEQQQLADMVQVSQSMICQIERGTKVPSLPLGKEIAKSLDCSLEELMQ